MATWVLNVLYCPAMHEHDQEFVRIEMARYLRGCKFAHPMLVSVEEWAGLKKVYLQHPQVFEIHENEKAWYTGSDVTAPEYLDISRRVQELVG